MRNVDERLRDYEAKWVHVDSHRVKVNRVMVSNNRRIHIHPFENFPLLHTCAYLQKYIRDKCL